MKKASSLVSNGQQETARHLKRAGTSRLSYAERTRTNVCHRMTIGSKTATLKDLIKRNGLLFVLFVTFYLLSDSAQVLE